MPQIARLNDGSDHGGTIITCSDTTFADGIGVARNGDLHVCPLTGHGVTSLVSNATTVAENQPVVRVGDTAGCGATIISGSPNMIAA